LADHLVRCADLVFTTTSTAILIVITGHEGEVLVVVGADLHKEAALVTTYFTRGAGRTRIDDWCCTNIGSINSVIVKTSHGCPLSLWRRLISVITAFI
jgi:hypothetical protein